MAENQSANPVAPAGAKAPNLMDELDRNSSMSDMQINVVTPEGETVTLEAMPSDTVADVKQKLADKEGFPPADQKLHYNGRELADPPTLGEAGIVPGSTLYMAGAPGLEDTQKQPVDAQDPHANVTNPITPPTLPL